MALKNTNTNEYLKITGVVFDFVANNYQINYFTFANEEQRQRFENGLSDYEVYKIGQYNAIQAIISKLNEEASETSIKNNLLTLAYVLLKNDMFKGWIDY